MHTTLGVTIMAAALFGFASAAAAQGDPAQIAEGAQLWGDHCTRCHNARLPSERSDAEWATIMAHMRARANLRKAEAQSITRFLQATNPESRPPVRAQEPDNTEDAPVGTGSPEADEDAKDEALSTGAALTTLDPAQRAALLSYLRSLQRRRL